MKLCSVPECERPRNAHGLCSMHYNRLRRTGDVGQAGSTCKYVRGDANARFWAHVAKSDADSCWLWNAAVGSHGYGAFGVERGVIVCSHRYSWELHYGSVPEGMDVLHRCDVRRCVNPAHLFLGTNADNINDMLCKERQARGEKKAQAKLTEQIVRGLRRSPDSDDALADRYGVIPRTIRNARTRKTWKHVE